MSSLNRNKWQLKRPMPVYNSFLLVPHPCPESAALFGKRSGPHIPYCPTKDNLCSFSVHRMRNGLYLETLFTLLPFLVVPSALLVLSLEVALQANSTYLNKGVQAFPYPHRSMEGTAPQSHIATPSPYKTPLIGQDILYYTPSSLNWFKT